MLSGEHPFPHRLTQPARCPVENGPAHSSGDRYRAWGEEASPLLPLSGQLPRYDDDDTQCVVILGIDLHEFRRRALIDLIH